MSFRNRLPRRSTCRRKRREARLENAVSQIDAVDPERKARRITFVVVHFDDWVGDYQMMTMMMFIIMYTSSKSSS